MSELPSVPKVRLQNCNQAPINAQGDFVLYWMIAFRRFEFNFSLQRAIEWAIELKKPLVIFEPLRIGYRWASDRIHRFVIDGMADNAARVASKKNPGILYYPYVEPTLDADKGLLAALGRHACVIVTDDFPSFFVPRMVAAVAPRLSVRLEQVDSNGLLPLRATDRVFTTAFSFRAYLQKELRAHLAEFPLSDPLARVKLPAIKSLPTAITRKWPAVSSRLLNGDARELAKIDIDHSVAALDYRGGAGAARRRLKIFLDKRLVRYSEDANKPEADARSELSPYLHYGHMVREGRIHNYLRMLWGKKILEWTATPQDALEIMVELNNRFAIDGRNPNSYSGIFWVLGRYDRPWGPERPIFGTIRYMSSDNTRKKLHVGDYLREYAPETMSI